MSEEVVLEEAVRHDAVAIEEAGLLGRWIVRFGNIFAIGIILSMLILIQEVFLRYVFNAPTIWAHETTVFLCGIAFIYGGLYCASTDKHIRVVLVYDYLSPKWRRIFDVIISIICAICSLFFTWAAWIMAKRAMFQPDGSFRLEHSGSAWDPIYPGTLKVLMLIILGIMAVQFIILTVNYARKSL